MFPQIARFTDFFILLLRLRVGLVFVTSGYSHLKDPEERAKSIGMSKPFTIFWAVPNLRAGSGLLRDFLRDWLRSF
jgi:putative oxidoreductase